MVRGSADEYDWRSVLLIFLVVLLVIPGLPASGSVGSAHALTSSVVADNHALSLAKASGGAQLSKVPPPRPAGPSAGPSRLRAVGRSSSPAAPAAPVSVSAESAWLPAMAAPVSPATPAISVPGNGSAVRAGDSKTSLSLPPPETPQITYPPVYPIAYNGWAKVGTGATPGPLEGASMAYDSRANAVILFGGYNLTNGTMSAQTWEYKAGVWTELSESTHPSARYDAAMSYDTTDAYVLLFGGITVLGQVNQSFDGTTWEFTLPGGWTQLSPTVKGVDPATTGLNYVALTGAGIVGDVLVGIGPDGTMYTWTYLSDSWTQIFANLTNADDIPPALTSEPGVAVYLWDGKAMWSISPPTSQRGFTWAKMSGSPPTYSRGNLLSAPVLVFDSNSRTLVYYGINDTDGGAYTETWTYQNGAWEHAYPSGTPPQGTIYSLAGVYDVADHYTLNLQATAAPIGGVLPYAFDWAYPPPLSVASITVVPVSTDQDQMVRFSVTGTGGYTQLPGHGPYWYTWGVSPTFFPCTNDTNRSFGCAAAASGSTSAVVELTSCIIVNLNQCQLIEAANSTSVALVLAPPLGLTVSQSRHSLDDGQSVSLTASASGGAGSYTYSWSSPPSGWSCTPSGSSASCTPGVGVTGMASLTGTVTDGNNVVVGSSVQVSVDSDPSPPTPASNVTSADSGQYVAFTSVATGGTGVYTYSWSVAGLGCTLANATSVDCQPAGTGAHSVSVSVTDTNGDPVTSGTAQFQVYADPSVVLSATHVQVDVNVPDTFLTAVSGGSNGFTYAWTGLPANCVGGTSASPTCTYSTPDRLPSPVTVTVTDSNHETALSRPMNITVNAQPTVTLSENRTVLDENGTIQFTSAASGGTKPYHYTYSGLPGGCTSQDTPVLNCTPMATGTFTVSVNVTDSGGGWSGPSTSVPFVVYPDINVTFWGPNPQWEYTPVWPINETYVGSNTGPLARWTGGDNNYRICGRDPGSNGAVTSCDNWNTTKAGSATLVYFGPGVFTNNFTIEDTAGSHVNKVWTITVYPLPQAVSLSGPFEMDQGMSATLVGSIANGSSPYAFWFNDTTHGSTLCSGTLNPGLNYTGTVAPCSFHPTTAGTYTLLYTVAYYLGVGYDGSYSKVIPGTENATLVIQVAPAPANLSFSATSGNYSAQGHGTLTTEVTANVTMNGTFSGGTGPYTCTYLLGSSILLNWTSRSPSCPNTVWSPATTGTFTLTLAVSDHVNATITVSMTVDVMSRLSVSPVSVSPSLPESGMSMNLTVTVTDSLPVMSYSWIFDDTSTLVTAQPWAHHVWLTSGTYTVTVTVVDRAGAGMTISTSTHVSPGPALSGMTVADGPINVTGVANGGSVHLPTHTLASFSLFLAGGTGPFTFTWTLNGTVVNTSGTTSSRLTLGYNFSKEGRLTLSLTVRDSEGALVNFTLVVNATADIVGPVTLHELHASIDAGMADLVTAAFTGGFAPYNYSWRITTPGGIYTYNGLALNWTFSAAGPASVALTVTDAFHVYSSNTISITVHPDLSVPCAPVLKSGTLMVGANLTFQIGCATYGTGPYTYAWTTGAGTTVSQSGSAITVSYGSEGNFSISVKATDTLGESAVSETLTVGTYPPTISGAYVTVLSRTDVGNDTQFKFQVHLNTTDPDGTVTEWMGGPGLPLVGSWAAIGQGILYLNVTENTTRATLQLEVQDHEGRTSAPFTLTVNTTTQSTPPSRPSRQGSGNLTAYDWLALAIVLFGVAALGVYLMARRRKGPATVSSSTGEGPKDAVSSAILDKVRKDGPVEEEALVQAVTGSTGAEGPVVRQKLQLLDENHWVVKQREGGLTCYSSSEKGGPTASAPPETGPAADDSEANEMLIAALSESAGGVTVRELRDRLGLSEAALSLLLYRNEKVLGFREGEDFDSTRIYVREGTEQVTGPESGVTFNETFLQELEARMTPDQEPGRREWDEVDGAAPPPGPPPGRNDGPDLR